MFYSVFKYNYCMNALKMRKLLLKKLNIILLIFLYFIKTILLLNMVDNIKREDHNTVFAEWNVYHIYKIKYSDVKDNKIPISIGDYDLIITLPSHIDNFYMFESAHKLSWIDDINIYSMDKHPTLNMLLHKIEKKINKSKEQKNINMKLLDTVIIPNNDSDRDIALYYERKKLEDCLESSKSKFSEIDIKSKNCNQLFVTKTIGEILINEYMNIYKTMSRKVNISLVNNNIFHWKLQFKNFTNKKLAESLSKINYIEVDLHFHDKYYPCYPPMIKIIKPHLSNSLMHLLPNTRMVKLDYWSPTRTIDFVVNKIYMLLDKYAVVDNPQLEEKNNTCVDPTYLELEDLLINLASLVDLKDQIQDIDDDVYEKIKFDKTTQTKLDKDMFWKTGTGYGHEYAPNWNIDEYIRTQNERDSKIYSLLRKIINIITQNKIENIAKIYNLIESSCIIPYIKSLLAGVTLLEINRHAELYDIIFTLLKNITNDTAIFLFNDCFGKKTLFTIFEELKNLADNAQKIVGTNKDDIVTTILTLYNMAKPCFDKYMTSHTNIHSVPQQDNTPTVIKKLTHEEEYKEKLEKLKFDMVPIVETNYYYTKNISNDKGTVIRYQKRLMQEYTTLQKELPIFSNASIFARSDPANMSAFRFLITGPKDTPYEYGCFIFDGYIPSNYPYSPPLVNLLNTGNERFNPNLYREGKVCLSLLNTWRGVASETWNSKTSTLYQVFLSIQSEILTDEPYFNEPGWERERGTSEGKLHNEECNLTIRLRTWRFAILGLLQHLDSYPQFSDVIKKHFYYNRQEILSSCEKWLNIANNYNRNTTQQISGDYYFSQEYKEMYQTTYNNIKTELMKLTC